MYLDFSICKNGRIKMERTNGTDIYQNQRKRVGIVKSLYTGSKRDNRQDYIMQET
jgi:hypothetical protein